MSADAVSRRLTAIRQQHQRRKDIATAANWSADDEIKDILLAALTAAEQARDSLAEKLKSFDPSPMAAALLLQLKAECEAQHARAEAAEQARDEAQRELAAWKASHP